MKHTPIPLYYQIKTRLLQGIESGQLKVGERIPSERELTERYGVSRMTARQALVELESQGYLTRMQGKGTYVSIPKLDQPLLALTGFTEDMRRRGMTAGAQLLSAEEVPAGFPVGQALGIAVTDPVYRLSRLRLANGEPVALEISHIPAALCPGLLEVDLTEHSLYAILRDRFGLALEKATQSLEAITAPSHEARLLKVREGAAILLMERVARGRQGRAIEFVRSFYRGDRYRFTTELIRPDEPATTVNNEIR